MSKKLQAYVIQKGKYWLPTGFPEDRNPAATKEKAKVFRGYYAAFAVMLEARSMPGVGRIVQVEAREENG